VAGATHLVEHLMLRACGRHDRRSLASLVDRLGGEVDAWTSSELMGVNVNTTVDGLPQALDLMVDALLEPTFENGDVELEQRVTRAELALAADDPVERVEEALLTAAWGDHPLARPVLGSLETLDTLTPDVLRRHHGSLVQPGTMVAAVVGDVDADDVASRLERLPLTREPQIEALPDLGWNGDHLTLHREGQDQVHARLGFEAFAVSDRRVPALVLLNRVLGSGTSSRLFQRLREDAGLTYDIWSAPVLRHLGGLLEVGWACAPEAFPESRALVLAELEEIHRSLRQDEIDVAREGLLRGLRMDIESSAGWCSMDVGEVLERQRRFDPARACQEIKDVSINDVLDLAGEILRPENMASAVCGPEGLAIQVA
jgi:predicted Zn-dependent peptidase